MKPAKSLQTEREKDCCNHIQLKTCDNEIRCTKCFEIIRGFDLNWEKNWSKEIWSNPERKCGADFFSLSLSSLAIVCWLWGIN